MSESKIESAIHISVLLLVELIRVFRPFVPFVCGCGKIVFFLFFGHGIPDFLA